MSMASKIRIGLLASLLVVGAAGCANHRWPTSAGAVTSDSWITTKVKSELVADKQVTATHIHVKTVDGVVTLDGTAPSQDEADRAVKDAENVKGVKQVVSNIEVKS